MRRKWSECVPRCSDEVDMDSDVTGGKVFDCVSGGRPINILLFAGTLFIPFKLFSAESIPKPLFPLLCCGLS